MTRVSTDKLRELIAHNSQMLKDAESGEWEKVNRNEVIREKLIKAFYSTASEIHEAETIESATHELLLVNEKLKKLAVEARDKVTTELNEIGRGKAAVSAYTKHMR